MGKFERKMKKRLNRETQAFDVWFEENRERFSEFENNTHEEREPSSEVKVKKKKLWLIPVGFFLAAICVFLCFLPMILRKDSVSVPQVPDPPLFFGDEIVYGADMTAEETETVCAEYPMIGQLDFASYRKLMRSDDDSLVFMIVKGELETENDYYFITMQIEYNPYYNFLDKDCYENLEQSTQINDAHVAYSFEGSDMDGLYWYYLLSEKEGQKIYWEVHCFEESINEFIGLVFA